MTKRLHAAKCAATGFSALAFLLTLALPAMAQAQSTTTTTTTDTTSTTTTTAAVPTPAQVNTGPGDQTGANKVVAMSPFEVQASTHDVGYYAQNTLSGSRLNSNLGDLGASITVITKQQMEDTSAIDINDLFLYEASTEGTENFTAVGAPSKGEGVSDAIQNSPQTSTRLRGLGAPDIARDYYITNPAIQIDSYILDRVDINRGPNSTLFGIGNPAGIVNQGIEQAVLNKDSNEISARFGSFEDQRLTLNLNRALIPDKLAIAVAGLYQDTHRTAQQPDYDIQRREFAAITIKPFANTTVRANVEYYDNPNRRSNSITPVDEISPWIANGRPSWDPITYTATVNGVTTAPITNVGGTGGQSLAIPPGLYNTLANFDLSSPIFYISKGVAQLWEQQELGTNFNTPGTPLTGSGTLGPIGNEVLLQSGGQYAKFASSAPAGQVTYPIFREPGIHNSQLLNYQGVNTLAANLGEDKAQIYNVEIEQQIVDNLFLDAGWYRENFNSIQHNYQGQNIGNMAAVDPNVRLLNGTPNPYFGRPYLTLAVPADINNIGLNEQERISLAYQLDFTKNDNWTKWFGHHNLMAFYQHRENDTTSFQYHQAVLDAHSWSTTTDISGSNNTSVEGGIEYKMFVSDSGSAISYGPGIVTNSNFTFPVTWYNTQLNGGTWTSENAKVGPVLTSGTKNQQQVWSYSGGLQDYFLNDRLILTLGQRHDYDRIRSASSLNIDPATGVDDIDNLSQLGSWNNQSGITRQAGGVLHLTKWLSAHYNQSDNFSPASLGEDGFGNVLPSPSGHGKDYGFALSFFDDKLVAEMNWYKADVSNSREGTTTYIARATRIDFSQFIPWAQEVATNNLGAGASGTAINTYANTIMQNPTGLQNFLNGSAHLADTQTVNSKGFEINLTYNPLRNWTMKFTADQDQAVDSAVFPHVIQYIAARLPVWSTTTDPVLGSFWTTVNAGNINGLGSTSPQQWLSEFVYAGGLDVQLAQQNHVQPDLSKYHFNFLTNYVFDTGPLKGFGVGGALRYETPAAIGYYGGSPDPAALGAIDSLQPFNPIYGKEFLHQDSWISYAMHLPFLDKRIRMKVQLNVRDLWSNGYLLTVAVNPDGSSQLYRIVPPRQWYLQTTFDF
jgi:outer membrane receptor protein involved in Fe transport